MADSAGIHLALALDGAGWHPAAWRFSSVPVDEFFGLRYWVDQAVEAERAKIGFLGLADAFDNRPGDAGAFHGRFDAVQVAAAVAPWTNRIGLVPATTVAHTEPFHVSTAVATVDYVSLGRAGWEVRVSGAPGEARNVGLRTLDPGDPDLVAEAADVAEVVRGLWDTWEDGAIVRDPATGRYLDRDRLHYLDFRGKWFSVKGPSVTPRPPQGQPPVAVAAHDDASRDLAARVADLVYVTPQDPDDAAAAVTAIRAAEAAVRRPGPELRVFADLLVFLDEDPGAAAERKARWDDLTGPSVETRAAVFTGTPEQLAEAVLHHRDAGAGGVRLLAASVEQDLPAITRGLVPLLRSRGEFAAEYTASTLRGRLGLPRPASRFAA